MLKLALAAKRISRSSRYNILAIDRIFRYGRFITLYCAVQTQCCQTQCRAKTILIFLRISTRFFARDANNESRSIRTRACNILFRISSKNYTIYTRANVTEKLNAKGKRKERFSTSIYIHARAHTSHATHKHTRFPDGVKYLPILDRLPILCIDVG